MADLAEQREFRQAILQFLQGGHGIDEGVVIGFALVVEMSATDASRHALVCTSDAGGTPLPWYATGGLVQVLDSEDEFDAPGEGE